MRRTRQVRSVSHDPSDVRAVASHHPANWTSQALHRGARPQRLRHRCYPRSQTRPGAALLRHPLRAARVTTCGLCWHFKHQLEGLPSASSASARKRSREGDEREPQALGTSTPRRSRSFEHRYRSERAERLRTRCRAREENKAAYGGSGPAAISASSPTRLSCQSRSRSQPHRRRPGVVLDQEDLRGEPRASAALQTVDAASPLPLKTRPPRSNTRRTFCKSCFLLVQLDPRLQRALPQEDVAYKRVLEEFQRRIGSRRPQRMNGRSD